MPRANDIVDSLLETGWDEPLPPKHEFDDRNDELALHAKTPFTAYSHALERGHHPRLWQAVRGSVYEPLYRKKFNVGEAKKPSLKVLKKHRQQLEPEERRMVLRRKAVWHDTGERKPTPGVWKAVVDGKSWYVSNTHRAVSIKPNLGAAIRAFPSIEASS